MDYLSDNEWAALDFALVSWRLLLMRRHNLSAFQIVDLNLKHFNEVLSDYTLEIE